MDVIVWLYLIWGYMWVYEGDLIWSRGVVLLGWKGWLYWIGVEFRWVIRGSVRGNRGTVIGLGFDRGVWFYCVCWDEVDNALRKGRGLPKNVNRGMYINTKKVKVILCVFITLTSTDKQKIFVDIKYSFCLF